MKNAMKTIKPFMAKYEPEILMSMGLAGMLFSVVWSVKATVKATHLVDAKKSDLNTDKLPFKELVKTTWKCYIPVAVGVVGSVPCIIAGNRVSGKRNAALAAAYTISETALQEYREKTKEIVGEKKEKEIIETVSKEKVEKSYGKSPVLITGDGDSLFYEPISGRYFKSNWNKILKAANELNAEAIGGEDTIRLSDWFNRLGLENTYISDSLGWSVYNNGVTGLIDIDINSTLTPDNVPCGAIYYRREPKYLDY